VPFEGLGITHKDQVLGRKGIAELDTRKTPISRLEVRDDEKQLQARSYTEPLVQSISNPLEVRSHTLICR
jgi:hypothetical protein